MKKKSIVLLIACSLALMCIAAIAGCSGGQSSSAASSASASAATSSPSIQATGDKQNTVTNIMGQEVSLDPTGVKTILVIGDDEWETYKPGHADMMCALRVDFDNHKITEITIPRDTKFFFPEDKYYGKLNYRYTGWGAADQAKSASEVTGLPIDFYVVINFDGFMDIVNYFDGIDVNMPYPLTYSFYTKDYPDESYEAGEQTLDGWRAMALSRARTGYGDSGVRNIEMVRQYVDRQMLTTLMQYAYSNSEGVDKLLPLFQQYIKTDIPVDTQVAWAKKLGETGTITVVGTTGPFDGDNDPEADNQWLVKPDPEGWENLVAALEGNGDLKGAVETYEFHEFPKEIEPVTTTEIKVK